MLCFDMWVAGTFSAPARATNLAVLGAHFRLTKLPRLIKLTRTGSSAPSLLIDAR
jgi:hypothetical protein